MARRPLIIGLTGPNAAGKGEVAAALIRAGFSYHSLSDAVRREAARRHLEPSRENLIRIGNQLRRRYGSGVLARRIARRLGERDVVDSIRNPSEVEVLRRRRGFVLVGVDAPVRLRFGRSRKRARPGDALSFKDFQAKERRENSSRGSAQQLGRTLALADVRIWNDGTLRSLRTQVRRLLRTFSAASGAGAPRTDAAAAPRPRSRQCARTRRSPRRPGPRKRPEKGTTVRA